MDWLVLSEASAVAALVAMDRAMVSGEPAVAVDCAVEMRRD
jgi:hypothetical protein